MRTAWNRLLEPCTTSYPAAFHPAHVLTCSVTPALCWASRMRLSLTGWAFADAHARCKHSANAATPFLYSFHALHMISCRLYVIFTTSLYNVGQGCYNYLAPLGLLGVLVWRLAPGIFHIQQMGAGYIASLTFRICSPGSSFALHPVNSLAVIIVYTNLCV